MESTPEQFDNGERSLEMLRQDIDQVDDKIFDTVEEGVNKGMGHEDLTKYVPKPIENAIDKTENTEIDDEQRFPDWVHTFGDLILEKRDELVSNYIPELIIKSYNDNEEGLRCRMALLVYSRATFALRAGRIKQQLRLGVVNEKREKDIIERAQQKGDMPRTIMEQVIGVCRQLQQLEFGILSVEETEENSE